jgi:hypothetical protein
MRKFSFVGLALLAIFAFGALTAASASAAISTLLAEWLWNGSTVNEELLVDVEGELLLEDNVAGIDVLCSGILDGWVNANGADLITSLLSLNAEEISGAELVGLALVCVNQVGCPEPLVWADKLPWPTLLELVVDGTEEFFAILILEEPGWDVECMGLASELCSAPEAAVHATNVGTEAVDAEFSEAFTELVGLKLALCTMFNSESGIVEGLGTILHLGGGSLTVSSV